MKMSCSKRRFVILLFIVYFVNPARGHSKHLMNNIYYGIAGTFDNNDFK